MKEIPHGKRAIRILAAITEESSLNISNLSRKTGIGHQATIENVDKLVKAGLVKNTIVDKERIISSTFSKIVYCFEREKGLCFQVS